MLRSPRDCCKPQGLTRTGWDLFTSVVNREWWTQVLSLRTTADVTRDNNDETINYLVQHTKRRKKEKKEGKIKMKWLPLKYNNEWTIWIEKNGYRRSSAIITVTITWGTCTGSRVKTEDNWRDLGMQCTVFGEGRNKTL